MGHKGARNRGLQVARVTGRCVASLIALVLVAASCGNAKTSSDDATPTSGGADQGSSETITGVPGVTDDEISYTVVGTKENNPLGTCILDCYEQGIDAYFAYRNSDGGIYGRKLVVGETIDDQLGQNQKVALGLVSDNSVFGTFEASLLPQGWGDLNDAGIPTYTWGIDAAAAANRDAVFPSTVIRCLDCTRQKLPYVAQQVGATKAGVLGYSASQSSKVCADSAAASLEMYEGDTGVGMAYLKDNLPYGLPNGLGPEVTEMKNKGVDFIATCFDLNAMKSLAQELQRQDMSDVVLYHPNSYDQAAVASAGDLFDGDVVEVQFRPIEADPGDSAMNDFKKWMKNEGYEPTELAMVGWINASLAYEGLKAAGPDFDRAKVIKATNEITDFTADGLLSSIDWGNAHTPYTQATRKGVADEDCSALVKVDKGKFKVFDSKTKPWLCWDGEDMAWSEPEATDFE